MSGLVNLVGRNDVNVPISLYYAIPRIEAIRVLDECIGEQLKKASNGAYKLNDLGIYVIGDAPDKHVSYAGREAFWRFDMRKESGVGVSENPLVPFWTDNSFRSMNPKTAIDQLREKHPIGKQHTILYWTNSSDQFSLLGYLMQSLPNIVQGRYGPEH